MNCVLLSRLLARLLIFQTCIPITLPALVCSYGSGADAQSVFKPNASLNLPVKYTDEATTSNDTGPFGRYQYVWNKTLISARDYQKSFCPRRCQNEQLVLLHDAEKNCPSLNCFPCQCGRPTCEMYGVCCPDVTEPFQPPPGLNYVYNPNPPSAPGSPQTTIPPSIAGPGLRIECDGVSSDEGPFMYINSCPHTYPGDDRTVKLCEGFPPENATLDVLTRSVDKTTGAIYRNRHCAVCNGVAQALQMNIKIECKTFMNLYDSQETEELFQRAMDDPNCRVEQIVPEGAVRLTCEDGSFRKVIDSCSQPDTEMYHDKDVVQACADLTDAIHTVHSPFTGQYYKNVFCAVCNTDMYPGYGDSCQCNETKAGVPDPLPFTMLLSFMKHDTPRPPPSTHSNCSDAEWPSPDGRCMSLHCVPGKRAENKTCVAIFPQMAALSYTIRLWLIPDVNHLQDGLDVFLFSRMILAKLELYLEAVTQNYAIQCGTLEDSRQTTDRPATRQTTGTDRPATAQTSFLYWSEIAMISDGKLTRDVVERRLSETLVQQIIYVDVNGTSDIKLTPYVVLGDFDFTTSCDQTPSDNVCNVVTDNYSQNKMLPKTNTSILFTSTLGCRFVSFNSSQYTAQTSTVPFSVTVSVNLGAVTLNFSEIPDLNMLAITSDGCLNVCEELLDEKLTGVKTSSKQAPVNNALYLVTMVSLGASMLGLVLTLITYCRFPALRTMAGMHTVLLSATLLCAQALLVASSHVKPPSTLCTTLGIVTHFVWLLKFTWTFICSFQMLRVFTAKTRSHAPTGRKRRVRLLKLSLGSLALPAVVIATVICYSGVSSHGEEIGYGLTQCYLDQEVVVGVAVAGPALAVSTCNIIFFCVTVVAISTVRKLHKPNTFSKDDHKNLHVYVKLSTMTGAFWAVSILAENLENDVLRFIAVVINGLQGVFIFLSYVCNKRIMYYYLPSWSGSDISTRVTHKTNLDPAHRDTSMF